MTFDLTFFALAIPAVLFAGISKGGFGSGAAFAATPILALILTPGQALGLMLPLLMLMDVNNLRPYWRKWDGGAARALLIGAVPGIALAAAIYHTEDTEVFAAVERFHGAGLRRRAIRAGARLGAAGPAQGGARTGHHHGDDRRLHQLRVECGRASGGDLPAVDRDRQDHLSGDDGDRLLGEQHPEILPLPLVWGSSPTRPGRRI